MLEEYERTGVNPWKTRQALSAVKKSRGVK